MQTEAQKRAVEKYKAKNYEYIKVRLNKGDKEILMKKVAESGKSMNQYILDKIIGE